MTQLTLAVFRYNGHIRRTQWRPRITLAIHFRWSTRPSTCRQPPHPTSHRRYFERRRRRRQSAASTTSTTSSTWRTSPTSRRRGRRTAPFYRRPPSTAWRSCSESSATASLSSPCWAAGASDVPTKVGIEQLYSPREVAYNNIEQYKQKQDRTDRTDKRSRATCIMWRKWWWRWWQKLPSSTQ